MENLWEQKNKINDFEKSTDKLVEINIEEPRNKWYYLTALDTIDFVVNIKKWEWIF